jgi:hypothetical protein
MALSKIEGLLVIPVIPKSIMLDKSPESNICLLIESNQID